MAESRERSGSGKDSGCDTRMRTTGSEITIETLAALFRPVLARYGIRKAILFGSWARGDASRRSDVDLILVKPTAERFLDRFAGILFDLNRASPGLPVEALIYTPEEIEAMRDRPFLAGALREGRTIYESVGG